jgi:hypothetical protein
MYLSLGDMFALGLALFSSLLVLVIAFQRVYVLEKKVFALKEQLAWERSPEEER